MYDLIYVWFMIWAVQLATCLLSQKIRPFWSRTLSKHSSQINCYFWKCSVWELTHLFNAWVAGNSSLTVVLIVTSFPHNPQSLMWFIDSQHELFLSSSYFCTSLIVHHRPDFVFLLNLCVWLIYVFAQVIVVRFGKTVLSLAVWHLSSLSWKDIHQNV